MCIRQASPGLRSGDIQVEATTRDEVGQYGEPMLSGKNGRFEICADGTCLLEVTNPNGLILRHKYEEDVLLPPGLYRWTRNRTWPGAPIHLPKELVDG